MSHENPEARAARLRDALRQFTGDLERYRHPLNRRVIYTPGVRYLAHEAGAYWLIDAIASWIGSHHFEAALRADPALASIHFWRLEVNEDRRALLRAFPDAEEPPFIEQAIPYSDFPLDSADIWVGFDGANWTLYLPSEH
ncbi:DUF6876 family protein [Botrimarina mediterranea]|uniref:DUF6876 family protein n=1 Tax=Botrimarina mediterranea TaxID=2528022 RepID=UPI00118C1F86|nr:hypothetical protein K2D_26940 [Planctomycetes bacterium K2D]